MSGGASQEEKIGPGRAPSKSKAKEALRILDFGGFAFSEIHRIFGRDLSRQISPQIHEAWYIRGKLIIQYIFPKNILEALSHSKKKIHFILVLKKS